MMSRLRLFLDPTLLPRGARRVFAERDGLIVWWAFWMVAFLALGGLAIDTSKAWRMKAMMQATADAATHAGSIAMWRGEDGAEAVKRFVELNMPESAVGDILTDADITYGKWNEETKRVETVDSVDDADAISISLHRTNARGNPERTTMLRILGFDFWNIEVASTARFFDSIDECLRNGLVAREVIDLQSNNFFTGNICVHSQEYVSVNNGNRWDEGVSVSMPDPSRLDTPNSDPSVSNPGLMEALREGRKDPKIVDDLPAIIAQMRAAPGVVVMANKSIKFGNMVQGGVYDVTCEGHGDKTMTIPDSIVLTGVTIVTNCGIKFDQGAKIYESVIASDGENDSGSATVSAPSQVVIGKADSCDPGGGSQILVVGDFRAAASFSMNGSQIIATGDIDISANEKGLDGVSLIAGGKIDVSSNNAFGACPGSEFPVIYNSYAVMQ